MRPPERERGVAQRTPGCRSGGVRRRQRVDLDIASPAGMRSVTWSSFALVLVDHVATAGSRWVQSARNASQSAGDSVCS